jgi:hypothetical protein
VHEGEVPKPGYQALSLLRHRVSEEAPTQDPVHEGEVPQPGYQALSLLGHRVSEEAPTQAGTNPAGPRERVGTQGS